MGCTSLACCRHKATLYVKMHGKAKVPTKLGKKNLADLTSRHEFGTIVGHANVLGFFAQLLTNSLASRNMGKLKRKGRGGKGKGGGTNRSDAGLNLSGSWQQGHSATYNTPSRI